MLTNRYQDSIAHILQSTSEPQSVDDIQEQLIRLHAGESTSRSTIYRTLNKLYQAVPDANGRYVWLSHILDGVVVRHPLTVDEARRGYIHLDELEHAIFFPQFFQNHVPDQRVTEIELLNGPVLTVGAYIESKTWALGLGSDFSRWIRQVGGDGRDSLIITVVDARNGKYAIRLQPRESRPLLTNQRNAELAIQTEAIISGDRSSQAAMQTWQLVARLIARNVFHSPLPPDDLHSVLLNYSTLRCIDGTSYAVGTLAGDVERVTDQLPDPPADGQEGESPEVLEAAVDLFGWLRDRDFIGSNDVTSVLGSEALSQDFLERMDQDSDSCTEYERYLHYCTDSGQQSIPLSHDDFHLLSTEFEYLLALQQEFGTLLHEQRLRKSELKARLHLREPAYLDDDPDVHDC